MRTLPRRASDAVRPQAARFVRIRVSVRAVSCIQDTTLRTQHYTTPSAAYLVFFFLFLRPISYVLSHTRRHWSLIATYYKRVRYQSSQRRVTLKKKKKCKGLVKMEL